MAIKVVQGLIDGNSANQNAGRADLRQQSVASNSKTNPPTSQSQAQQQFQQAATSVTAQVALTKTAVTSEAALTTIRANRGSNERQGKIEDPDQARALADSVADRLEERDEEALEYHSGLHPGAAREHFVS